MFKIKLAIQFALVLCGLRSFVIGQTEEETPSEFYIEQVEKVNWFQAWNSCSLRHMYLVSLDTKAKTDTLVKQLKEIYGSDHPNIWIGGNDKLKTGQFMWIATNQTFSYKNWAPGQPDNKRGKEHCALLWEGHNYRWNDGECLSRMLYVCEKI